MTKAQLDYMIKKKKPQPEKYKGKSFMNNCCSYQEDEDLKKALKLSMEQQGNNREIEDEDDIDDINKKEKIDIEIKDLKKGEIGNIEFFPKNPNSVEKFNPNKGNNFLPEKKN